MKQEARSFKSPALSALRYGVLALAGCWMLLPFFWMLSASLMTSREIVSFPPPLLPAEPQWHNYADVTRVVPLGRAYVNSLVVTGLATFGVLLTSSLAGFAFAKYRFPGRWILFLVVLATTMIPPFATIIPLFYVVKQLGWLNNYAGLVVPFTVSAYGIFLMRQFMLDLPDELIDAARIDGASEPRIYWQIVLPLVGPALATLGSFTFVASWNSFLWPLLVAQSRDLYTVPLALNSLRIYGQEAQSHNLQMAGTVLGVIPAIIVFASLQRYFVRGIAITGLK